MQVQSKWNNVSIIVTLASRRLDLEAATENRCTLAVAHVRHTGRRTQRTPCLCLSMTGRKYLTRPNPLLTLLHVGQTIGAGDCDMETMRCNCTDGYAGGACELKVQIRKI